MCRCALSWCSLGIKSESLKPMLKNKLCTSCYWSDSNRDGFLCWDVTFGLCMLEVFVFLVRPIYNMSHTIMTSNMCTIKQILYLNHVPNIAQLFKKFTRTIILMKGATLQVKNPKWPQWYHIEKHKGCGECDSAFVWIWFHESGLTQSNRPKWFMLRGR